MATKLSLRLRQNSQIDSTTPMAAPWNDMPPSHAATMRSGLVRKPIGSPWQKSPCGEALQRKIP